jgi:N-acetyl sugar amidotransferase
MKWCLNCVLPDTRPNLVIESNGICNACNFHNRKEDIDWDKRHEDLLELIKKARVKGNHYDCVVPVSGGKDSTWQVLKVMELGLKPLCVTWRPPGRTDIGQKNLDNLIQLGVDHIDFSISPKVDSTLTRAAFEKIGIPAAPMHMAIFNIPAKIAVKFKIPLIIWGENSAAEYGAEDDGFKNHTMNSEWIKNFGVSNGTTALDWVDRNLNIRDLEPYIGPTQEEIDDLGLKMIFLGYFIRWDPVITRDAAVKVGFQLSNTGPKTGFYDFADLDDHYISVHHWMKWYKFGFTRLFDNLSLEIRNGRLDRQAAIQIISEKGLQTPFEDISKFCDYLKITTEDFFSKAETFRNKEIWKRKTDNRWKIENFLIDDWNWE